MIRWENREQEATNVKWSECYGTVWEKVEARSGRPEREARARELWVLCVIWKALGKINIEDYFVVCELNSWWNLVRPRSGPPSPFNGCMLSTHQHDEQQRLPVVENQRIWHFNLHNFPIVKNESGVKKLKKTENIPNYWFLWYLMCKCDFPWPFERENIFVTRNPRESKQTKFAVRWTDNKWIRK